MILQVGVKVILKNRHGNILILRRTQTSTKDMWDIPGGRIDTEEPLLAGLKREVTEETGMTLVGEPVLLEAQDIFVETKDLHVVRLTYFGVAEGDVILSDEHDEFKWVDVSHAPESNLDPYLKNVLEDRLSVINKSDGDGSEKS